MSTNCNNNINIFSNLSSSPRTSYSKSPYLRPCVKNSKLGHTVHQRSHSQRRKFSAAAASISPSECKNDNVKFLANADSGATGNYLRLPDMKVLRDVKVSSPTERIAVEVAEGTLIYSSHHGYLDVPAHGPMMAYIFPQLKGSLLSISELVNVGLHLVYCKNFITAFDNKDNVIFQGKRDMRNGLWMVDLQLLRKSPAQPQQNELITSSPCQSYCSIGLSCRLC